MSTKVGIIGATGMVGQRFIQMLEDHPEFSVESVMASERSAGKKYQQAAKWYLSGAIPTDIADMEVDLISSDLVEERGLDLVFSAIPSKYAQEVESAFAQKIPVYSNTKTFRMVDDVPLVIAQVNSAHLKMIKVQQENRGWDGYIVTNPNCSTIGLVVPLKPILDNLGIKEVTVATMQAVSGAGYDGVSSMAILGNIVPHIGGEEVKVEAETLKILGGYDSGKWKYCDFPVAATCNRVSVINGHLESVFVKTEKDFEVEEVKEFMSKFSSEPQDLNLHTAPKQPIVVMEEEDRPQPRRDIMLGGGMAVSVGRIFKRDSAWMKFTCLSHNTVIGAAGASILNAELAAAKKLL